MKLDFSKNSVLSVCLFFVTLYFLVSFEEFFIHRYMMHNVVKIPFLDEYGKEHIKHHIATNKDFSIKNNDSENICFDFFTVLPLYLLTVLILYLLFNKMISLNIILIAVFITGCLHMVVWNTLHSYVHYFDVNTICKNTIYGIPKEYINEDNFYVKWSLDNHRAHHYFKKEEKGNWNVVFPGADYIMGTHNTMPKDYDKKSV
jgi:hypothetical protein